MTDLLFPPPPLTLGQQYTAPNGVTYSWDGIAWTTTLTGSVVRALWSENTDQGTLAPITQGRSIELAPVTALHFGDPAASAPCVECTPTNDLQLEAPVSVLVECGGASIFALQGKGSPPWALFSITNPNQGGDWSTPSRIILQRAENVDGYIGTIFFRTQDSSGAFPITSVADPYTPAFSVTTDGGAWVAGQPGKVRFELHTGNSPGPYQLDGMSLSTGLCQITPPLLVGPPGSPAAREKLDVYGAVVLAAATNAAPVNGTLQYTGAKFQGRVGGAWVDIPGAGGGGAAAPVAFPVSLSGTLTVSASKLLGEVAVNGYAGRWARVSAYAWIEGYQSTAVSINVNVTANVSRGGTTGNTDGTSMRAIPTSSLTYRFNSTGGGGQRQTVFLHFDMLVPTVLAAAERFSVTASIDQLPDSGGSVFVRSGYLDVRVI